MPGATLETCKSYNDAHCSPLHLPKKDCNVLVTHEIVHISPDLKHDAHVVKQFTTLAIDVIRKNGIKIHKIIQFTDQAPSQYKNKTAFRYLTQFTCVKHLQKPFDKTIRRVSTPHTNFSSP